MELLPDITSPPLESNTRALTDSRLAALCANAVYRAFLTFHAQFRTISRRARERLLSCDWAGASADAGERLGLYGRVLDGLVEEVHHLMSCRLQEKPLWAACKAVYSSLITDCQECEIAETFFNSLTRRVFTTIGVNQQIEFVDSDFDAPPTGSSSRVQRVYQGTELPLLLRAILTELGFPAEYYTNLAVAIRAA